MEGPVEVGDEVWVKPGNSGCTTEWTKGRVTNINSTNKKAADSCRKYLFCDLNLSFAICFYPGSPLTPVSILLEAK